MIFLKKLLCRLTGHKLYYTVGGKMCSRCGYCELFDYEDED